MGIRITVERTGKKLERETPRPQVNIVFGSPRAGNEVGIEPPMLAEWAARAARMGRL